VYTLARTQEACLVTHADSLYFSGRTKAGHNSTLATSFTGLGSGRAAGGEAEEIGSVVKNEQRELVLRLTADDRVVDSWQTRAFPLRRHICDGGLREGHHQTKAQLFWLTACDDSHNSKVYCLKIPLETNSNKELMVFQLKELATVCDTLSR
jgi:hypothetical protein